MWSHAVQVNFPMSPKFRPMLLLRWSIELVVFQTLFYFMADQFLAPAMVSSIKPMRELEFMRFLERMFAMALPNVYCWLLMFYSLFHLLCNILAEITRFGDREFYKEWWNARDLGEYWKLWNIPVHRWCLRTLYYPALRYGYSK